MTEILDTSSLSRRSFLIKSALTAGTLAGAGALLDACGSSSAATSSTNTTLTVMYSKSETPPQYFSDFVKQNPGTKVNLIEYDATRLSAMLAAGTPPDFLRVNGATDLPNLAVRSLVTDLTSYMNKSSVFKSDDLSPANGAFQWDGKQSGQGPRYGVVKDWSQDAQIWYNKKIFDDAKVPYPSETQPMNYDELLALAKRLTKRDGDKIQIYGLDTAWEFQFTYNQIVHNLAQTSTSLFNADGTKSDFTQPEVIKLLQWYVDWAQAKVGPSPLTDQNDTAFTLFPANRLAMVQFGYWFGGATIAPDTNGLSDHVGLLPTPQWGPTRKVALFAGTGACIPQGSKNKDLAFKFMEFFTAGTMGQARVKTGDGLPALKSQFASLPTTKPFQQEALKVVNSELPYLTSLTYTPYATSGAISTAIAKYITPVIKKQASLQQGAQQLTDAVNLLLQQGKSQVS